MFRDTNQAGWLSIEDVALHDVDRVGLQPTQIALDPRDQLLHTLRGQMAAHRVKGLLADLGHDDEPVTAATHGLAQQLLTVA